MNKQPDHLVGWTFVFLAAVAAIGGVVIRLADMGQEHKGGGDLATWVGAVFAGLAFAGTIFIATNQQRREDRQRIEKAKVFGPAIAMRLSLVHPTLNAAVWGLRNTGAPHNVDPKKIAGELDALTFWTDDELEPLICIAGDVAVNLTLVREAALITAKALMDNFDMSTLTETELHLAIACRYAQAAGDHMQKFFDRHATIIPG